MKTKIVALILTLAMLMASVLPTYAAGEEFLSDVALVYEDSVEDARKAIEGTDWKLFEKDLNPNADVLFDDGVYLIYKTSTNVEDAITDLRVMDMYGGYSNSNYQRELENSKAEYRVTVSHLRVAIDEFKAQYAAGDAMAALAYRQMNFYKDVGESDLTMGDFFLMNPTETALVQLLMQGNPVVVDNLISLLAIGISGAHDKALASRIGAFYDNKDALSAEEFHEDATELSTYFEGIEADIRRYDVLSEEYDLTDDEMTEEEFQFLSQYATLTVMLEEIALGDFSLADMIRGGEWTVVDLYPVVAALTEGQRALVALGQLETVLKYSAADKPIDELNSAVDDVEQTILEQGAPMPLDVYTGVDRSVFEGEFSMTDAAMRQQALTGNSWNPADLTTFGNVLLYSALTAAIADIVLWTVVVIKTVESVQVAEAAGILAESLTTSAVSSSLVAAAVGVALLTAGLIASSAIYNYYNTDYLVIPDTMVDIRETDLGDRYIKYTAAKVFGEGDKNADFNAYQGKEWNALYYTKDASAGNCLTPNFVYRENNATVSRRHQGVSMFGETDAFDLNSHVYNEDADGIYLTVRYSTTKKAAADIPAVVGSIFNGGSYALTAGAGICLGMGLMALLQRKKKNPAADADAAKS